MKKIFCFCAGLLGLSNLLFAQDLITTRTGEDIQARVVEIGLTEVKYYPWNDTAGTVATLPKENILLIRYEDGGKEIFEAEATAASPQNFPRSATQNNGGIMSALNNTSMFQRGQIDAKRYYTSYKEAGTVSLLSALFLGPLFGLIPTVAIATTTPNKLDFPNESLMRNVEYSQGYVREAKSIKSAKTWTNYAIGVGISVALFAILFAAFVSSLGRGW